MHEACHDAEAHHGQNIKDDDRPIERVDGGIHSEDADGVCAGLSATGDSMTGSVNRLAILFGEGY